MNPNSRTPIRIGIAGSSWWVDSMYLPALQHHPLGRVTAIAGRDAPELADRWQIETTYPDWQTLLESGAVDAVIVATRNHTHFSIACAALEAGLHVLCEKPIGLNYREAAALAELAAAKGAITMTPFTYHYMPAARYLKQLIDQGYLGRPFHLNLRYSTGFGLAGGYNWRFDMGLAGSGALGDIASHFLFLATWFFGPIEAICAQLGRLITRAPLDPAGQPYPQGDDNAMLMFKFASGAEGMIHASTLAYEPTPFGQIHEMDFHGADGSLHCRVDWDTQQSIRGAKRGEQFEELAIPESIWAGVRRDTVHNTYRDVFRTQDTMARRWVNAIANKDHVWPDFAAGATIQRLLDAAILSHSERRWVDTEEIIA